MSTDNDILEFINGRWTVDDVFNDKEIFEYVEHYHYPSDVFGYDELEQWALNNKFIHMDDLDYYARINGYIKLGGSDE